MVTDLLCARLAVAPALRIASDLKLAAAQPRAWRIDLTMSGGTLS